MARALGHIVRASLCCAAAVLSCACALLAAPSQALAAYGGSIDASSFPVELFDGTGFYWDSGNKYVFSESDAAAIQQAQQTTMSFNQGDTVSVIRIDYTSNGFSERTSRYVSAYYIMRTDNNSASDDFSYQTDGGGYIVFGDSYSKTLCGEITIDYVTNVPVYYRCWYEMDGVVELTYPPKSSGKYKITVIYTNNNSYWQGWNLSQVDCEKSFSFSILPTQANFFDSIIALLQTISEKLNFSVVFYDGNIVSAINSLAQLLQSGVNTLSGDVNDVEDAVDAGTSQSITNTGNITSAVSDVGDDVIDAATDITGAIDGLSGQYTDSIDAISLHLQDVAGVVSDIPDALEAISSGFTSDIGGAVIDINSEISAGASGIADAVGDLQTTFTNTMPTFGQSQWGNGTSAGIDANAKSQFDSLLRQKAPVGYLVRLRDELNRMSNKYNSQSAGLASNTTMYIDVPVPYAGNVRFDFRNSFLGNSVAGYSLQSGFRYAITIMLTLGTLLAFGRIAIGIAFGGGGDD